MGKKALITGITGQDGSYLAHLLLQKGYQVIGAIRRNAGLYSWRLERLGIVKDVEFIDFDLLEYSNIKKTLERVKPDEVYNLAAQSFVGLSFEQPLLTSDIDGLGTLRVLESVREAGIPARIYQASTSEMFGKVRETPQNEQTPFHPRSPYGVAKVFAHWAMINYRESYQMFAANGILFNHESPLRGEEFVTRKITRAIAGMKAGTVEVVELGNMNAKRDWGYARDYVDAMWRILQHQRPDDFVIATGETHSVREFVELAFRHAGMSIVWSGSDVNEVGTEAKTGKVLVKVSPKHFRPAEVDVLIGDATKAKTELGWSAATKFEQLVGIMMEAELDPSKRLV
ncbi:MAG: GDP-mannose 4,6-dehydratase [Bacteroidetes bacterium]|jgi:GDPmannose 4,6-dehydratase|nr:GDP-mannose 4,6-dehydratase [Bacteroidota bacterium]